MGLFRGIKSLYKKSEAIAVVKNLLDFQEKIGLFGLDTSKTAETLIELVWKSEPDVFDGKFGQRPHKVAVAASALANVAYLVDESGNGFDRNTIAYVFSLGNILSEISTNGRLYAFNGVDEVLLEKSEAIFAKITQKLENSPIAQELENSLLSKDIDFILERKANRT